MYNGLFCNTFRRRIASHRLSWLGITLASITFVLSRLCGANHASFAAGLLERSLRSASKSIPKLRTERDRHVLLFFGSSSDVQDRLDGYVETVGTYTDRDAACLPPKWRTLLIGMKAGLQLPSLLKAARTLYVNILPLRIGADFIVSRLAEVVREGDEKTKSTISDDDLMLASTLFELLDVDASGGISEQDLLDLGFTHDTATSLITAMDANGDQQIDLFEFMADNAGDNKPDIFDLLGCHLSSADVAEGLSTEDVQRIVAQMRSGIDGSGSTHSEYEERFDTILRFIIDLEPKLKGRNISSEYLQTVLAGSFEAARNSDVVSALRMVYVDNRAIRVAGDMVYGIVNQVIS